MENQKAGITILTRSRPSGRIKSWSDSFEPFCTQAFSEQIDTALHAAALTPLPVLVLIQNWRSEFAPALLSHFPRFSSHSLAKLNGGKAQTSNLLPSIHGNEINFALSHVQGYQKSIAGDRYTALGLEESAYRNIPIATCVHEKDRQTFVLFVGDQNTPTLIDILRDYYCLDDGRRWMRLRNNYLGVVTDLLYLFIDWDSVLNALNKDLRDAERRSMKSFLPVTIHTKLLHYQMATCIELREMMRFHTAVARFLGSQPYMTLGDTMFGMRLSHLEEQIDHDIITLNMIHDQFHNLVQLARSFLLIGRYLEVDRLGGVQCGSSGAGGIGGPA